MAHSVNTSHAVIVLGDRDTVERNDLADTAAAQGAVIAERYSFEPGQAVSQDNISEVEEVIAALSRAVATRTDVWLPFPFPDFGREQHIRRISLVLQRHGLNIVLGQNLEPCTTDGGFNAVDFALREEVRSVDELDYAVLSSAGIATMSADIERELSQLRPADSETEPDRDGNGDGDVNREPTERTAVGEKFYSTAEVARFFGKSVQWVYWGMREGVFTDRHGAPIEPMRIGKSGRRRFTLPVLREMARSCYRRGIVSERELLDLLGALSREETDR